LIGHCRAISRPESVYCPVFQLQIPGDRRVPSDPRFVKSSWRGGMLVYRVGISCSRGDAVVMDSTAIGQDKLNIGPGIPVADQKYLEPMGRPDPKRSCYRVL